MSILAKIFDKIFPWADGDTPSPSQSAPTQNNSAVTQQPQQNNATVSQSSTAKPISSVDVEKILDDLGRQSGQTLNWKTSIVDLLKLLNLDSSLQARKELAEELDYPGDTNDSATMNIWLHKELMKTLAANGGKIPAELKD